MTAIILTYCSATHEKLKDIFIELVSLVSSAHTQRPAVSVHVWTAAEQTFVLHEANILNEKFLQAITHVVGARIDQEQKILQTHLEKKEKTIIDTVTGSIKEI